MTNWRERGYVPASDGEDSDAELSTQEESLGSPIPRREETPDKLGRNEMGNGGDGGDKMELKISGDTEGPGMELLNATDGEFMDIDKALGVATQPQKSVRERLSIEHMTAVLPADIPVVDLSNQRDEADDEDGGVGLQDIGRQVVNYEQNFRSISDSPDPLTGEPQPRTRYTLARARDNINERRIPEVSSAMSSPLSSVPSSPVRTLTPPSSLHPPVSEPRPAVGFQVVVTRSRVPNSPVPGTPAIEETSPFFERSLRNRKPIQLHPYALEDARYKMQMKAKGVQPVRILEMQEQMAQGPVVEDSRDKEYEALSQEKDSQSPQRRMGGSSTRRKDKARSDDVNDFVDAVYRVEQRRQKIISQDGSKRRKLAHAFSEKPRRQGLDPSNSKTLGSGGVALQGAPSLSPVQTQREGNVYDFPESQLSSPSRTPLRHRNSNTMLQPAPAGVVSPGRRDGFRSFLDYSSDSDLEPLQNSKLNQGSPIQAKISRPRAISVSSNESSPRRMSLLGSRISRAGSVSDGSESKNATESEDSSLENRPDGPSKVVKFFKKRGTKGVLPASYIRFAEKSKPNDDEDTHHQRRQSTAPPEERRPGVARAKVSSRIREPVQDLFPQDIDDSDDSDELIITASAPVKSKQRTKPPASSAPPRRVVNLLDDGDIPEDNRIDYGLPAQERRRPNALKAKRKRAKASMHTGSGAKRTYDYGHASSRRRKLKRSSGPQLGIVDAAAHLKKSGDKPPPRFLKVAARNAITRKDYGRQSPAQKLFVLDTVNNTQEVQDVLRNWREGTLPFGRCEEYSWRGNADSCIAPSQSSLPPTQRLGNLGSSKATRLPAFRKATSSTPRPRQTSLLHHDFQRQTSSGKNGSARPRKSQIRPLAVVPLRDGYMMHRPAYTPQPAQFERDIASSQRASRQHPTSLIIENVIHNLRHQRLQQRAPKAASAIWPDQLLPRPTVQPRTFTPPPPSLSTTDSNRVSRRPIRRKKQIPQRVDADTVERRQPPAQDLILDDDPFEPIIVDEQAVRDCLSGLLPFGSKYSLSFDTSPLKDGTIFNADTYIGKGNFTLALNTLGPRVHAIHQGASYRFEEKPLYWGVYEDSIATEFEAVMGMIGDAAEKRLDGFDEEASVGLEEQLFAYQAYGFYGFVTKYIAETLSFHDHLDAVSFAQRFIQSIERCCSRLSLNVSGPSDTTKIRKTNTRLVLQANAFCLVVAFQIFRLSSATPDVQEQLKLPKILRKIGRELLSRLLRVGVDHIRACYEDQRRRIQFERGIGSEHYLVELWVLAIHTLDGIGLTGTSFWAILNDELHVDRVESSAEVKTFEKLWRTLFTLMPLYQFDDLGLTKRVDGNHPVAENWSMVKLLAGRPLRIYNMNKNGHSGTINDYLRIIYARCYNLITKWYWTNPDSIIPVLFEFFSSNGLANLSNEHDRGSPDFLLNLDKNPVIEVVDSDQCFHLLLKIIVVGLKRMRITSTARKTSGLVYRLMPNHRRQYPKDEDLRVEHLDSLKNHHYLLETLYWAAPPDCRPPLDAIRLLVDPETSHREACTVAIRAWTNLLRFQLHSGESLLPLKALMLWFDDLATKTLGQHQLARSEAEKQFRLVQETEDSNLSEQDLEANIRRNQRQLEALLNDLVKSLCLELASISGHIPNAIVLLTPAATANILNSYTRLSNKLLLEVLSLLQQFLKTCNSLDANIQNNIPPVINTDEDSQDYGDWSGFEEVVMQDETKQAAEHFLSVAYDSLHRMLSNCFGADIQPEETLLVNIVDTWTSTAGILVKHGIKTWDVYLEYSRESWSSLRDTPQTRKFTAYFLPKIIYCGVDIYQSNRSTFLGFWMRSLVERESMLKFQNEFTATLLDVDSENPLLNNLPFERDSVTGLFKISQFEFRMRRLPLISSVLEKMRETYKAAPGREAAALKQEYAEMLRAMMKAMKENFEVLRLSTVSGAYVDFVHRVVEFLLQYSTDIVEIDKFFTDSSAFPLPAMDPNYVVGQLKKYVFGLSFPGTQKQLNAFFQTLGERAALGNEQEKLVSQLSTALSEDFETGDTGRPTMRAYFLHAVFPAYIEAALEHPAGWVFGVPVLKALRNVVSNLKINMDSTSYACANSTISMLATILDSMRRAANRAMSTNDAFSTPHTLGTLTLLLKVLAATIPVLAWIYDEANETLRETAKECSDFLIRFAVYARKMVTGRQDDEAQRPLDILAMSERPPSGFEAGRRHCKDTLSQYLAARWRQVGDGGWMVGDRAVSLPLYPPDQEKFLEMVVEVVRVAGRTEVFGDVIRDVDASVWAFESRGLPWIPTEAAKGGRRVGFLDRVFC